MRLWLCACLTATTMASGAVWGQMPSVVAVADPADNALPPITEPPVDVPMHVPKPPRDVDAPATPRPDARPMPPQVPGDAAAKPVNPFTWPPSPLSSAPATTTATLPGPPTARPTPPGRPGARVVAAGKPGDTISFLPPCREAAYNVLIDGRPQVAHARLCLMPDGAWRLAP